MHALKGYKINRRIYESRASLVFRGTRESDGIPVIIKILQDDYPTPGQIIRYRQEFEITRSLSRPGVVGVYSLEKYGNTPAIILEDFGGESLKILNETNPFSLKESIALALTINQVLGEVHEAGVIHKDINPANIVYNRKTDRMKLIDFGLSTRLSRESPRPSSPDSLEGTLAYISPEQTGRMNCALDYRTDYYGLGAGLYELITGRQVFEVHDDLELVHCHLARQPTAPHLVESRIPENLSRVVMKLLAKRAEDRYQSALGIRRDLEFCLEELDSNGKVVVLEPGAADIPERFELPGGLYGRKTEIKTLLEAAERAAMGQSEVLVLTGYAGSGKSVLVGEMYQPLATRRGYFVSGKFDLHHRNVPFSALRAAGRELIRQFLTESEEQVKRWRKRINKAISPLGGVLVDFLPELELILGEQAPVPELEYVEVRNRFGMLMQKFIGAVCRAEHPLVLFLDDLQWADRASLDLMGLMAEQSRHFFLIFAYRDNEVEDGHPLLDTIEKIRKTGNPLHFIKLQGLGLPEVRRYIADTLRRSPEEIPGLKELSDMAFQKTDGNPFFLGEFMNSLYHKQKLYMDESSGTYCFDVEEIRGLNISNNVVELMIRRIDELPGSCRELLTLASCLGAEFSLSNLSRVSGEPLVLTAEGLWPALERGLLLPLNENYKVAALLAEISSEARYKFAHDRIHEGAYSLIPEDQKPVLHLRIGRILSEAGQADFFDIVDHLNRGALLLDEEAEKDQLIRMNLEAGRTAQSRSAFEPAFGYFKSALGLADAGFRERDYASSFELLKRLSETAYLSGFFDEMRESTTQALSVSQNLLDTVQIYEIRIMASQARNRMYAAVKTALVLLRKLGFRFPKRPGKLRLLWEFLLVKKSLFRRSVDSLVDLPQMQDPVAQAALRVINNVGSSSYQTAPELSLLFLFRGVRLSLKYGNGARSPIFYCSYGFFLMGGLGELEQGYEFGLGALRLAEREEHQQSRARTNYLFNAFIGHWKEPMAEVILGLQEDYHKLMEIGDPEYACRSLSVGWIYSFLGGVELGALEKKGEAYTQIMLRYGQEAVLGLTKPFQQVLANLRMESEEPVALEGRFYREELMLSRLLQAHDESGLFYHYFCKMLLAYWFFDIEEAERSAREAVKYKQAVLGLYHYPVFVYYDSLILLAKQRLKGRGKRFFAGRRLRRNLRNLKKWADFSPQSHGFRYLQIKGEAAWAGGNHLQARLFFEKSLYALRERDLPNEAALCWENAGRFYLENDSPDFGLFCFRNARFNWMRWGAEARVQLLDQEFPELVVNTPMKEPEGVSVSSITRSGSGSGAGSGTLDLKTVMKAARTIADEIELSPLLEKIMKIMMENAGAQRGFLLLNWEGRWFVEAQGDLETYKWRARKSMSLKEAAEQNLIPEGIIHFALRTRQVVSLNDAVKEGKFTLDPYVKRNRTRSILCLPVTHRGDLPVLLYLENNLATGVFTSERLQLLEMLSSQAAISIEHAHFTHRLQVALLESSGKLMDALSDSEVARKEIETHSEISRQLNAKVKLEDIVSGVFAYMRDKFGMSTAWLQLVDEKSGELYIHSGMDAHLDEDTRREIRQIRVPMNESGGLHWRVVQRRRPLYIKNQKPFIGRSGFNFQEKLGVSSYLLAPLLIQDEVIGILNLASAGSAVQLTSANLRSISRFCAQIAGAVFTLKLFEEAQTAREIFQKDIRTAQKIQEALLPGVKPQVPGLRLHWKYVPMFEVGGDLFDLLYDEEQNILGFFICDVSGHGVPAALLASMVKIAMKNWATYLREPAGNLIHLRNSLMGKMAGNALTAFMGYLDMREYRMVVARAGHPPMIRISKDGTIETIRPGGSLLTEASFLDFEPEEYVVSLEAGDRLIFYTDGITEVEDQNRNMLEMDGFIELLRKHSAEPPVSLCDKIHAEVTAFAGRENLDDDFTLLVLYFDG